jgi:hypothetical protein
MYDYEDQKDQKTKYHNQFGPIGHQTQRQQNMFSAYAGNSIRRSQIYKP